MKRRILSIITALALCLSLCPTWALAAEADLSLCRHHPKHTEDCGYAAPTEGHDCGHAHTEDCYTTDEAGGKVLDCHHTHDSACGYVEADPGAPCGYACRICPIEALIAALPEQVTEDNADDVRAQLDHILDLYRELNEDEQAEINLSRIYALQGALEAANDPAPAADEVKYQVAAWNSTEGKVSYSEAVVTDYTLVVDSATAVTWNAGWYVVNSSVTISEPITVTGAVNLILADGCTLNAQKGIVVETGNSLTIYAQSGSGTLNATGTTDSSNNASAGIGGSTSSFDSGTITIHGGAINATGGSTDSIGYGGAGIGGGTPNYGNGGSSGAITIYGGTVTANSGEGGLTGAGIGGGGGEEGGTSSNITIYGGSVTAASIDTSTGGAGIGGGSGFTRGGGDSNIQIHGGTVNATGGYMGAGIGGGADSAGTSGNGTVTISGGIVTAVGGNYAAGIGGGGGYSAKYSSCTGGTGSVTISGGIVDATGGAGNSSGNYAGDPIGNGGNTTATATVNKTTGIVFENGAGTVCGDVTLNGSYEVPAGYSLHIPASASLSGSGTLSGGSAFTTENLTADMISVPTDLYYDGKDRTADITTELSGELDKGITICGQTFTVSGWTLAVEKTDDLHYTATYTNDSDNTKTVQKTITLLQSGTDLTDGKVKTFNGETETPDFTAGDTITVKATPTATGKAPDNSAMFAASFTAPTAGQMAVFVGDTQVSAPVGAVDGSYTMEVSAAEVLLQGNAEQNGNAITLTAKFVGNDNMADAAGTVDVRISAVAMAEKDGEVIGYFGVSDFEGTNNLFYKEAYADATITLLGDVKPGTNSDAGTTCSTMVNITCTLDLAGHNFTSTDTAIYVLPMGNLTIQDSSTGKTGNVSFIKSDGTLTLYGGTFGKIETAYTLSSLLAENCAYYRGSTPILLSELEGQKTLDGTVTVQECQHTGVEVKDLGSGKHGLDCPYCGYHSEHTTTLTATVSGNTVTFRGGCESCDYRAETLATAAFTIPKLTYGQTDQTVSCTWEHPNGYALMVQIDSGEELQLESSDTQVSLPLKQLFGSQEINAGNYQLHVYCRSYADVTSNVCSLPVTVDPAPLPEVTLSAESATYNGTEQKPALSVQQGETALTEGTDYEVSYTRDGVVTTDFTNAGTVNITVTGKGNYTGSVEKTYTIGKATPTIAWANDVVTLTYTGQPADIKPVVTLVNGETFSGTITYHHTNTDSSESGESKAGLPTNAGIYVVGARIPEQDNYTAATTASLMLMINKADQTVPAAPTADEENIKDTSITLDTIENAEYKRDDGEWQESPTFTGLEPNQAYTFYARLKADDNHNASLSSTGTSITTRKAMLENASVTITGTYTYTGAAIVPEAGNVEVVLNGTKIDSDQYTISASNNINAGVGKATLTVTATETGNYSGSVSTTFSIGKATLYVAPNSQTIRYGESIREGASAILTRGLATGDHVVGVTLTPDTKDVPGGRIIASEVQIQNESGADVTGNYEITYVPGALIINKSQPTIAFADGYNPGKTYDGQTIPNPVEANLTITGATFGDVAFAWSATPKNAGTYTLTASIPVTDNTEAAEAVLTVTISPKAVTPTITITPDSYKYTGSAIHPSGSAVKVMDGDTVIPDSEYTLSYGENTQVGTGSVIVTDKENGNYTVNGTTTFTITAKPLTGAKVEVTGAFTYTGSAQKPAPTVTLDGKTLTENTDYTVAYADNTNAGTAKITVTGMGNYSGTAQGTFTIGRADLTVDGTGTASGTYGDKLSELTVSGLTAKLGEGTVSGTWKLAGGTVPNVGDSGEYTATFTPATGADNYNALTAQVTLNIAKADYSGTTTASTSAKFGATGTYDLSALLPDGATAGTAATTSDIFEGAPTVSGKTLSYTLKAGATLNSTGTITVPVTSTNYNDFDLTITVTVTDKDVPTLTVSPITVTYTGQAIPANAIQGTAKVGDAIVPGTWAFASGEAVTNVADSGTKTVKFVPTDKETYAEATGTVVVTINKATPTGAPKYTAISASGKTLADAGLTAVGGTFNTEGTVAWTLDNTTEVTANTQYEWTFTPTDTANYNTLTGKITLWPYTTPVNPGGGGGYVPSDPGGSTLPVTTTGQGSTTTTTTTTATPTASVSNGTATTTINTATGNEIVRQAVANNSETVVIAPNVTGSVTKAEVSIPASTVGQIGSQTSASLTVSTPVADVTIPNGGLGSLSSAGGTVTVTAEQVGSSVELTVTAGGRTIQNVPGGVTLTVPAANTTPGTVAVLVHPDGTREVVRKSVADNGAVTIPLDGSAKLEIVDNSRQFADVPATSWTADAVAFASAHELFNGTAPGQFSPNLPMSRGMLAVVLHNLESNPAQALTGAFADVDNNQWYAEGVAWAEAQGIIGGYGNGRFGPNDNITREQLAVMLWRYAGSPAATDQELHFADADKASGWALDALRWATENGIINGKGGGILDPTGQATRAETAQMLKNFMEKQ